MKRLICVAVLLLSACAEDKQPQEQAQVEPLPQAQPVPAYPSLTELAAMLNAGDVTSADLVAELLRRISRAAELNAFITIDADAVIDRARELDDMRQQGNILGPLHGIPVVVKDNIHVAGLPNTAGTPGLSGFVPREDNAVVAALREAGAIVLGKTNLHELAFGITSDNAEFGAVANPYDVSTFAGGSSGGTASAVSAGLAPAGLGTDTGGSVRIPAALTGIVGFRPSSGRYESSAVTPISHTRDTIGLIARGVADVEMLDRIIAPGDPATAYATIAAKDIRLGVPRDYYFDNLDGQSAVVVESALAKLRDAGVTLVETNPRDLNSLLARSGFPIALYEVARDLPDYLATYATGQDFGSIAAAAASPDVQGLFMALGGDARVPDEVYADAIAAREELRSVFREYYADNNLDAIIFPTTLLPARSIDGSMQMVELNGAMVPTFPTYIHNTDPASIAALPGISLPVGVTSAGLPVGLEIDGPEGSDRKLLAIAAELERLFAFSARP